jgi:hypothetical protein
MLRHRRGRGEVAGKANSGFGPERLERSPAGSLVSGARRVFRGEVEFASAESASGSWVHFGEVGFAPRGGGPLKWLRPVRCWRRRKQGERSFAVRTPGFRAQAPGLASQEGRPGFSPSRGDPRDDRSSSEDLLEPDQTTLLPVVLLLGAFWERVESAERRF